MNDTSMSDASTLSGATGVSLEHASFPHLSLFEWEALHRLAAVSGDGVIRTLLTAGTEEQQRLAAQEFMAPIEARQLSTELARTRFLLSKLSVKPKEWALGRLVANASCFPTMAAMQADLRLAFEPPQDESVQRSAFLSLKQGGLSMLEYIQRARHLASCITTQPVDITTQVHVFVSGMNAGYQRFYLTRKTPSTLEEAFTIALREDYILSRTSGADVAFTLILHSWVASYEVFSLWQTWSSRGGVSCSVAHGGERHDCERRRRSKKRRRPVGAGRPTGCVRSDGSLVAEPPPSPPVLHARLSATTSGSDSRLIVLSLHVEGAQRPIRALLDSGATNNFVRAASLSALPADMSVRESGGEMIVKYADGKPRRTPRRSATFAYEFDGFRSSEEFLVIELSGSFDCVFGIPWLARHQPAIDWLAGTVRPRDIDVNAVEAFLCGTPTQWPHVTVMDPDSMTHAAPEESDGPSCAVCEYATCAGPEQESQDASDVVEHGGSRKRMTDDVVEHGFPRPDEQWLSPREDDDVVERGLPLAVEHGFPRVVERELPEEVDAAEQLAPRLGADDEFRHSESADVIEQGFSPSAVEDTPRPVRRRGRHNPRRPRALSPDPVEPEPDVISVLVGNNADESPRACNVEVARPPCDAAEITRLPGLSWKHFLRDLKRGEIGQVCMIVAEDAASIAAVKAHASDSTSDAHTRPKGAEPKNARAARYAAQSLPALEAAGNPVAPLVREFSDIFPDKVPAALPPDRGVRHEIDIVPGAKYFEAIDAFFEGRRQAGHVRESLSPHSSPTFCVKKATGGWRIVHAFNKLNDATIPAQTPIPRKDMVLDTMSGSTNTPSGMLWEWLVMPQGLKNAPATFNRMVSNLLRPYRDFAPSYFDDIFIHSRAAGGMTDVEMHLQHLRQVFEVMRENQLYANLKKCIFCAPEIPVLGSYVSTEGVRADPEKIAAICAWPVPQDQKQLRQWLGLATYLHHYSKNFAATIRPLSQLLKADAAWSWRLEHQTAFDAAKTSLSTAPVLMLPDHSKPFHVVCDASDFAIGCALMQFDDEGRERVISYQSRQLKPAERNYPVHDKELLGMRYALIKFRVYLLGEQIFAIYTDHASLRTATKSPHLSQRMARWLSLFSEYNFVVHYKPGKTNILADALSRRPDYVQSGRHAVGDEDDDDCAVCVAEGVAAVEVAATSPVRDLITNAYKADPVCSELIKFLRDPTDAGKHKLSPRSRSHVDRYSLDGELLTYCVDREDPPRIVVPLDDDLRARLIHEFHDTPSGGHLGREKTFASLSRDFYWPHMYKWIRKWVRSCEACQRVKPNPSKQAPLRPLSVATDAWASVSMDFVFGLPRDTQGRTGVLVIVDRFSKMLHLAPVAASITAKQTAAIFVDAVYRHHGLPSSIVSDRDPRFTSAFWRQLFQLLGTRLSMSTASHPETDGQTERANRVVEDVLRSFATSFQSWSTFLPMVEFALNNAVHASTGLTPFFVNFGRHPRVPDLLGVARSETPVDRGDDDAVAPASLDPDEDVAAVPDHDCAERRGPTPDAASALLHSVTTRQGSNTPAVGTRTRAATRAAHEGPHANPERASRTRAARRAAMLILFNYRLLSACILPSTSATFGVITPQSSPATLVPASAPVAFTVPSTKVLQRITRSPSQLVPQCSHLALQTQQPVPTLLLTSLPTPVLLSVRFLALLLSHSSATTSLLLLRILPMVTLPDSGVTALRLWWIARATNVTSWKRS
uniref:Integrase catalytic domain-containing protein n=1 Tax=Phytophthora ramorum TaxID=164328 RepID=H3H2L9_PHYRM